MSLNKQEVAALYVAVYNRAPDANGLSHWTNANSYVQAAEGFTSHPKFEADYGTLNNQQKVETFYTNMLGGAGDADGIAYWVDQLNAGMSDAEFLAEFLSATLNYSGNDADALNRKATLVNKANVAVYYADTLGAASNIPAGADLDTNSAYLQSIDAIADVTSDNATVTAAKAQVDTWAESETPDVPANTQNVFLTEGADRDVESADGFIKGAADANTTFIGDIVQNQFGQQVNTLGTGDRLDGGNGANVLNAQVTQGAYAGGESNMAIQAQTKNVQKINLEAVQSEAADMDSTVYVNAKNMENVNYIGSEQSNASLVIQDLTSKGVAGGTANMTVGMKYTGNADSKWSESDLTVLFDQDYLTRESELKNGWNYEVLNQAAWDNNSSEPVKGFPLERITFTLEVDGVEETVALNFTAEERAELATQADLVTLLNAKLDEKDLSGLNFALGSPFYDGDGRSSTSIDLINTASGQKVVKGTVGLDEDSPAGNLYWSNKQLADVSTDTPVTVNVELEKVGRAADGGELVIGSMNKTGENIWIDNDEEIGVGTVSGVERFNVTVDGGKAESSSLSSMRSTNNNLREVNIVSAEGSDANLTIGNSNISSTGYSLKDVQTLNAEGFKGDLTVNAQLTGEVTQKYLAGESALQNFVYTGGEGDDVFNVSLDTANWQNYGSTTHARFDFAVNSGEGDDVINVDTTNPFAGNWYTNQKTNSNLSVNAGTGDDTVNLRGTGDWVVDLGAGDDVIYVDNGGEKASWIFNAVGATPTDYDTFLNEWDNVVGGGNPTFELYKTGVTLTLTDDVGAEFELNFALNTDNAHRIDQKTINETIKWAIENDPIFSKLVKASTGQMADTLIIDSLIDGDTVDLDISFNQLAAGSTQAQIDAFNATYNTNATSVGLANAYNPNNAYMPDATGVNGVFTTNTASVAGTDGGTTGDQMITGGTGNDIFVLGTSGNQDQGLVYEGFGNGTDTVLNFTTGDFLSFVTDAKFVDFGQYDLDINGQLTTDWDTTAGFNGSNDYGLYSSSLGTNYSATNLVKDDVFFRVTEDYTAVDGQYTVEAFKVTATGDVSVTNANNIQSLGTVGTIDFGQDTLFDSSNFFLIG